MVHDIVEKAARKELRLVQIKPEDIVLMDSGSIAFGVAQHVLKQIFPKHEFTVQKKGLFPISKDERNAQFLTSFFEDSDLQENDFFLSSISYEELCTYARKHNLEIRNPNLNEQETFTFQLLQDLQQDQSQTMAALHNASETLRKSAEEIQETPKKKLVNIKK